MFFRMFSVIFLSSSFLSSFSGVDSLPSSEFPSSPVDKILLVDVYHEFKYPYEMMESIKKALRPNGKIFIIEYRGEDPKVPIKKIHKMTEKQVVKEMKAIGLKLEVNMDNLPWQHCLIFEIDKKFK